MGVLSKLMTPSERRDSPANPSKWLLSALSGWSETAAGIQVTPENALAYTAVLACVRVLAESVAQLPLLLYERLERGKQRAIAHPLYGLLHDAPNTEMTAFEFRETLMGHLTTWGNAYAEIERAGNGRPVALWPLRPDRMRIERVNGQLTYFYWVTAGEERPLAPALVLHLRGLSSNGIVGYSPIALARQAVGLGLATEEFGSRFFGNGARPGMILEHPGQLSNEAHLRLRASWEERHRGLEKAHRVAILEEGMKVHEIGIPPEDAQFLETRKFQRTEIAAIYRVPPHMIGDLERATFSNIEHQGIEFVVHSLGPWLVRWEQRIGQQLLSPAERRRYFAEHLVTGLLRGDTASRFQAYAVGRQWGWLSANDVRELENMNPVNGGDGYLSPLNMVESEGGQSRGLGGSRRLEGGEEERIGGSEEQRSVEAAQSRQRLARSYYPALRDVAQRIVNREVNDLRNAARRLLREGAGRPEFEDWLIQFLEEHVGFIGRYLAPVFETYASLVAREVELETDQTMDEAELRRLVEEYVASRSRVWVTRLGSDVRRAIDTAMEDGNLDPAEQVDVVLEKRQTDEADDFARDQVTRAGNAVAKLIYLALGVSRLVWRSFGESCPYCRHLDGHVIGIEGWFLPAGDGLEPAGQPVFVSRNNIGHPPLHNGCDCMIVAG